MDAFEGKTAVITGGASGIGLALAAKFADARMNIVLADIEREALDRAVADFESRQTAVLGVPTDTMRRESIEDLLAATTERFGNVHILCNNAGVVGGGEQVPVWEVRDVDWEWVMGVNFNGVLYGLQTFVPHMLAHGEAGHIVNTASVAALMPGGGPYGVSKHGVLVLTEGLHRDLSASGGNIGASVLCPGWVNTKIAEAERNRPGHLANPDNPNAEGLPIGDALTMGKDPAEVAEAVFDAIREGRCYVLPHSGWDKVVSGRVGAILARGAPFEMDIEGLLGSREAGEDV